MENSKNLVNIEDVKMTKEEIRAFYEKLEKSNDPYFDLLPVPNFMLKENPEKYGYSKDQIENIFNGIEYLDLQKEDEEKARQHRLEFINDKKKERQPKPATKSMFGSRVETL